ncbi:MAG: hypothetical protein EOO52_16425 [Gammaproteobacteria bacterium]|nr:MAG: hypothetical protein EOO52_16425 [Gammaproteobacteria bacterium]
MEYRIMFNSRYSVRALISALLVLMFNGLAFAQEPPTSETITHKFVKINNSKFNVFALKSKDALNKYSKIYYVPMSSKNLVLKRSGDRDIDRSWKKLKPEDWLEFTSAFDVMVPNYFPKDKNFSLTDKIGPDVLAVQFRLVEYTPRVLQRGEMDLGTIGTQEARSYGELLIMISLVDSVTHETIGIASDGIAIGGGTGLVKNSNAASQMVGWQRAYEIWLNKFREQLDSSTESPK